MQNLSPKSSSSSSCSPKASASSSFWETPHGRYDIHRSIFISRKILATIRVFFSLYFLVAAFAVFSQCENYAALFQISKWSFFIQTVYYIQAAKQSLSGRPSQGEGEPDWKLIHTLYEVSFSFQLFNFIYYCLFVLPSITNWRDNAFEIFVEFNLGVVSFVAIWFEQLFNLMRLYIRRIWLIISIAVVNLIVTCLLEFGTDNIVFKEVIFQSWRGVAVGILMLILPIIHFSWGCNHYDFKRKEKNNRRKHLGEQLISLRRIPRWNSRYLADSIIEERGST